MPDSSTVAYFLTFTGTLAVALALFLGQVAAFTALLALAGICKLLAVSARALLPPGA